MKVELRRIAEQLVSEEACLGAIFCTYNFDPAFFEEQLLRTVLRLRSDPDEAAIAFHEEARRALSETPVAVLLDARMRASGRRLPYDQLLVRKRTFHPKLALLVFEEHACLLVGSCNVTRPGFERNVEAGFLRRLRYAEPADAATLREARVFLEHCGGWAVHRGTQLDLAFAALDRRLPPAPAATPARDHRLLAPFDAPILDQLLGAIPAEATVSRVGILAPYFELDDRDVSDHDGAGSFLAAIAKRGGAGRVEIDVGVSWADSPVAPGTSERVPIEAHLGELWAWRWCESAEGRRREHLEYLVPTSLGQNELRYRDAEGQGRRWDRASTEAAWETTKLWRVPAPALQVPPAILRHLADQHELRLWLHPTNRLSDDGRVMRRGLHAKLFLITTKQRARELTYVLVGSPNASRAAMLRTVADNGNVELAVLFVVEGPLRLVDLLPELVQFDLGKVQFAPVEMTAPGPDLSAWIEDAAFDAANARLTIQWARAAPTPLGSWTLRYGDRELAHDVGAPQEPTVVEPFSLRTDTAELTFVAAGHEWSVPVRVVDLAALPVSAELAGLGLRELLALLGGRLGTERYATLRGERGDAGTAPVLDAILGEGFGPVDVFKAWWGLAAELEKAGSLPAFRQHLVGSLGVRAVWKELAAQQAGSLSRDEVWFYGAELVRTLRAVNVGESPDAAAKGVARDEMVSEIEQELVSFLPSSEGRPWVGAITRFYGGPP